MSEKSKSKKLSTTIPPMESEFDVDIQGEITKKRFLGTFSCSILNRKARALVDRHRVALNGPDPANLSMETLNLHHKISYLRFALTAPYPKFWEDSDLGYGLYDGAVIDEVYSKVLAWEEEWMREVWGDDSVDELKDQ